MSYDHFNYGTMGSAAHRYREQMEAAREASVEQLQKNFEQSASLGASPAVKLEECPICHTYSVSGHACQPTKLISGPPDGDGK